MSKMKDITAAMEIARQEAKAKGFEKWISNPQTKLLISMIKATEPPELVTTLLRTAFEDGVDIGAGTMVAQLTIAMMEARE